jgi:hypothetical protein
MWHDKDVDPIMQNARGIFIGKDSSPKGAVCRYLPILVIAHIGSTQTAPFAFL